ncbi:hypothetical protein Xbed_00364 [Xenorhabdus beddingii]|uniref:Uncharacterized protein n=1 Tax=Xenorhabdus beddingii TaxID=40578 RepID=A0A1Y2SUR2_9GAMM|nr:hypothetical protein Xbed_00364 [Xenorhabdus beddingii]
MMMAELNTVHNMKTLCVYVCSISMFDVMFSAIFIRMGCLLFNLSDFMYEKQTFFKQRYLFFVN